MTPTADAVASPFESRAAQVLRHLEETGQYKLLQTIEGPMDAVVRVRGRGECLCFCSNNYLGLANHPEVVEAGVKALREYGAGTASVRFICGTFGPHETVERRIAELMGTESSYTLVSCWNANEALFATLCEPGDVIISDELNHASIIDGIRLATVIKKGIGKAVYRHGVLNGGEESLEGQLRKARAQIDSAGASRGGAGGLGGGGTRHLDTGGQAASGTGAIWVVTDGVFSMEGDIADLPAIRGLCDRYGAVLVVDDSHGTGVMGERGRGTHEHYGMSKGVDIFTGTLGKALGGAAGGFVAGSRAVTEMLVQRARPTLFSNALPVTVACSAAKAIEVLLREPQRVAKLRENVAYARGKIKAAGLDVLDSPTAICPIIVHDTAKAIAMSRRLLELGVFVIGFGYPVVPEGHARLRVQISAAHEKGHIDRLVEALKRL